MFISLTRFASTLVNFRLRVGASTRIRYNHLQPLARPIALPNLLRFEFSDASDYGSLRQIQWVQNHLLPRFINLKTLRLDVLSSEICLFTITEMNKLVDLQIEALDHIERFGLWELCRKLEIVEIPCLISSSGNRHELVYRFQRPDPNAN